MNEKPSQLDRILAILECDGEIRNFDAIHSRISLRLGARIFEARKRGYIIETEELPNHDTVYRLISKPEPKQMALLSN